MYYWPSSVVSGSHQHLHAMYQSTPSSALVYSSYSSHHGEAHCTDCSLAVCTARVLWLHNIRKMVPPAGAQIQHLWRKIELVGCLLLLFNEDFSTNVRSL